jgi:hypothetical protein
MRKTRNKGAGALRTIDIMDHKITTSLNRVFKPLISIIMAPKIPRPRTMIDRLIDGQTNTGIFNTWVKKLNRYIRGVLSGIVKGIVE